MMVDADSIESMSVSLDPRETFVEHVVDFDSREIIPVALKIDGTLIRIADGEFGEATKSDFFEENDLVQGPADKETE